MMGDVDMTERERKLRQMLYMLLLFIAVLCALVVWNMAELHALRTIAGGEYIPVADCRMLIDSAQVGPPLNLSGMVSDVG